jgi:serine phosphatase RsbU (regulator of sigma subunit)
MRLDDFDYLPSLADGFAMLSADRPGLALVAGLDLPVYAAPSSDTLLPSGRTTIFRILAERMLADSSFPAAVVAADPSAFRVPRPYRERVMVLRVGPRQGYRAQLAQALARGARLLILDQLAAESAGQVAPALASGATLLTQLNSPSRGIALVRELEALGLGAQQLPECLWLVAVQRLPMLCRSCRRSQALTPVQQLQLSLQPGLGLDPAGVYQVSVGCEHCEQHGHRGTVALFDLCRLRRKADGRLSFEAVLPLEQYAHELAQRGDLSFDDVVDLDGALSRRIFQQSTLNQHSLDAASQALERKIAELNSANHVLQQRTTALLSFQAIGRALLASTDLGDLARRVCHSVRELCGADRAALYILHADGSAAILALSGWDGAYLGRRVAGEALAISSDEPQPVDHWPPGIEPQHADVVGGRLRAGLCAPLVATQQQVGMLFIHSMQRGRFEPGEIALLQTFAQQAALLIQRAHLIDELRAHLARLQEAQAALVSQQRLAREMELAAEVQRSILPRTYPHVRGLSFAAENRPAREVGGDFYDVFMLDASRVGLVIADVSGKGMPAALYMALSRSLLLAEARRARSPQRVLLNVNRLLREVGNPRIFVSMFYGIIDTRSKQLTYARAGHDYPLLLRDGEVAELAGEGTVLGMLDVQAEQLAEQQIALRDGDRLVLYTDGLIDVVNEHDQHLTPAGLLPILREQQHADPELICTATLAALARYQGAAEQYDDMTILVVGVGAQARGAERGILDPNPLSS